MSVSVCGRAAWMSVTVELCPGCLVLKYKLHFSALSWGLSWAWPCLCRSPRSQVLDVRGTWIITGCGS